MKRTILCLAALSCLITPSMALAGGGCGSLRGRIVTRIIPNRNTQTYRPTYQPTYQPVHHAQPAPQPAPRQYQPAPPKTVPTTSVVRRTSYNRPASQPVLTTADRLEAAKQAFRLGHNNVALAQTGILIEQLPDNANLLQFRSLVYFRKGDYRRAALDAYEAVKHGAIWNTSTINDLYAYPAFYQRELRLLRVDDPTDLSIAFLSAYHYLVAGDLDNGRKTLQRVLEIKPSDKVAAALINLIDTRQGKNKATKLAKTNN